MRVLLDRVQRGNSHCPITGYDNYFSLIDILNNSLYLHYNCSFFSDHVRGFSCGMMYYRTFHLDVKRDVLYVGAM